MGYFLPNCCQNIRIAHIRVVTQGVANTLLESVWSAVTVLTFSVVRDLILFCT